MDTIASRWEPESDDAVDPDAPEGLLHYKWGYVDGHLTRWTRRDLDEIELPQRKWTRC